MIDSNILELFVKKIYKKQVSEYKYDAQYSTNLYEKIPLDYNEISKVIINYNTATSSTWIRETDNPNIKLCIRFRQSIYRRPIGLKDTYPHIINLSITYYGATFKLYEYVYVGNWFNAFVAIKGIQFDELKPFFDFSEFKISIESQPVTKEGFINSIIVEPDNELLFEKLANFHIENENVHLFEPMNLYDINPNEFGSLAWTCREVLYKHISKLKGKTLMLENASAFWDTCPYLPKMSMLNFENIDVKYDNAKLFFEAAETTYKYKDLLKTNDLKDLMYRVCKNENLRREINQRVTIRFQYKNITGSIVTNNYAANKMINYYKQQSIIEFNIADTVISLTSEEFLNLIKVFLVQYKNFSSDEGYREWCKTYEFEKNDYESEKTKLKKDINKFLKNHNS
jgi:hypothetical protein